MSSHPLLEVRSISKTYNSRAKAKRQVPALSGVSLEVRGGEILAVLGLNGAGKTTLMKIMLGLLFPTDGEVIRNSLQNNALKIGYLPEGLKPPWHFTGQSFLQYAAMVDGLDKRTAQEAIARISIRLGMEEYLGRLAKSYSKGMLLRLGIAQALLSNPQVVFLDEPTDGLDPAGKRIVRELLTEVRDRGIGIVINSQLLSEVELMADTLCILHRGKLKRYGKLSEMLPREMSYEIHLRSIPQHISGISFMRTATGFVCKAHNTKEMQTLLNKLKEHNVEVLNVFSQRTSLEDVFFSIIGD